MAGIGESMKSLALTTLVVAAVACAATPMYIGYSQFTSNENGLAASPAGPKDRLIQSAAASVATTTQTSTFELLAPMTVPESRFTDSVVVGDVTGDGLDEVVTASTLLPGWATEGTGRGRVTVHIQDANGQLSRSVSFLYGATAWGTALALGDLDGDGLLDIIVGHDIGLTVYMAKGNGEFTSTLQPMGARVMRMVTLDFNQDGILDLATEESSINQPLLLMVHPGLGNGSFGPRRLVTELTQMEDLEAGDVNGDALDDLVFSGYGVSVVINDGASGFLPPKVYVPPHTWRFGGLAIADYDNDGRNDVAVGESRNSPTQLWIYPQLRDGMLGTPRALQTYDIPASLTAGDLDRDGRPDLVVGHSGWFAVGYYTQETGSFDAERRHGVIAPQASQGLAIGDINNDGCGDVAVATAYDSDSLKVMFGHNCQPLPARHAARDVDADGKSDLLWRTSGHWAYWRMDGATRIDGFGYAVGPDWRVIASADFDGTGYTDLVWTNGVSMQMWRGSATGFEGVPMSPYPTGYRIVAAGDLDGDGNADLVWRDDANTVVATWFMRGATIIDGRARLLPGQWSVATSGDLNGDARMDLAIASTDRMMLWTSNPNRTFSTAPMGGYPIGWSLVGAADIDGDRRDDLMWRHAAVSQFVYWTMRGPRRTAGVQFTVDASWHVLGADDYNGDGRADIVWTNGALMQLWESHPGGIAGRFMPDYPANWTPVR